MSIKKGDVVVIKESVMDTCAAQDCTSGKEYTVKCVGLDALKETAEANNMSIKAFVDTLVGFDIENGVAFTDDVGDNVTLMQEELTLVK